MLRTTVPVLILSITGIVVVIAHFSGMTKTWGDEINNWFGIISTIALLLGAVNLLFVNLEKVSSRRPGWAYAAITLVAFLGMLAIGFTKLGATPNPAGPDLRFAGNYESQQAAFGWMYQYVMTPLTSTMFALLAFYVASAAFRAFRAKNFEAILLLGTAFVILLGQTYASEILTGWIPKDSGWGLLRLDSIAVGITETVATAGMRAIMIGIAIGAAATSIRFLLGVDRGYLAKN